MGPENPLPCSPEFESPEQYVDSLLSFIKSSELLQTLCGGVHVLDFFTRTPDLYTQILAPEWRLFFQEHDIMDILDLLMREDLQTFENTPASWRNGPVPPESLLQYIKQIRRLSLRREHTPIKKEAPNKGQKQTHTLARQISVGMNIKKIHEVDNFCRYLDKLTTEIGESKPDGKITHLVDFGAGQNYLGRALASEPYNKHIIALESKQHNIQGARTMDVRAKLAPKQQIMRNKKEWKVQREALAEQGISEKEMQKLDIKGERGFDAETPEQEEEEPAQQATLKISNEGVGSIQYVEHYIKDGDLSRVVPQIVDQSAIREKVVISSTSPATKPSKQLPDNFTQGNLTLDPSIQAQNPHLLVISLHSCGNLVHHGLRSLLLNPTVTAVALVGCCYNLLTTRLGAPSYKHPSLRTSTPRLATTSSTLDPHGFPMSSRLCTEPTATGEQGLRLNITARMMAVQAPQNWTSTDSSSFFKRHFYRALLQKIFVDNDIVQAPNSQDSASSSDDTSPLGWTSPPPSSPIILGSLRKSCYISFIHYVRGALDKLRQDPTRGIEVVAKLSHLTDEQIQDYENRYRERERELAVLWSLMAFSAGVVEAVIVVDRWLWLGEQEQVEKAWVEVVFDFEQSPRNLVVVGVKK